ncbi:MAG TPA: hypothetical protein VMF57_12195 [Solirubrobacteraceae bacterium]|nr:hypothetical protein [Solirubrobacteraceae bacterium]
MNWPRLLMCWIPEGWDGPTGPSRLGDMEVVYVDRAHGFGLFLMRSAPRV